MSIFGNYKENLELKAKLETINHSLEVSRREYDDLLTENKRLKYENMLLKKEIDELEEHISNFILEYKDRTDGKRQNS